MRVVSSGFRSSFSAWTRNASSASRCWLVARAAEAAPRIDSEGAFEARDEIDVERERDASWVLLLLSTRVETGSVRPPSAVSDGVAVSGLTMGFCSSLPASATSRSERLVPVSVRCTVDMCDGRAEAEAMAAVASGSSKALLSSAIGSSVDAVPAVEGTESAATVEVAMALDPITTGAEILRSLMLDIPAFVSSLEDCFDLPVVPRPGFESLPLRENFLLNQDDLESSFSCLSLVFVDAKFLSFENEGEVAGDVCAFDVSTDVFFKSVGT